MGHPERPAVPARGAPAARASVPGAADPGRAAQAPGAAGRDDRVACRRLRRPEPRQPRRSAAARLDPGRVRPVSRDRSAVRSSPTSAGYGYCASHSRWFWGMRLHLACAPDGTPRAAALVARRPARTRDRADAAAARARKAARRSSATRATPAASSPTPPPNSEPIVIRPPRHERTADPAASRADPPTDRIRLLDLQRPAQTSNATAPAPRATSTPASAHGCSRSPPASASTTNSADPAAQSSTTPPNPVASTA